MHTFFFQKKKNEIDHEVESQCVANLRISPRCAIFQIPPPCKPRMSIRHPSPTVLPLLLSVRSCCCLHPLKYWVASTLQHPPSLLPRSPKCALNTYMSCSLAGFHSCSFAGILLSHSFTWLMPTRLSRLNF